MAHRRQALGEQGLHIVKETGKKLKEIGAVERKRRELQKKVEAASVRPAPGTSELLAARGKGGLRVTTESGVDGRGKLREVDVYDLLGMAPIHLKRRGQEEE